MPAKKKTRRAAKPSLPDKPSELILVALADLAAVEKTKGYSIAMDSTWHEPTACYDADGNELKSSEKHCVVCFAGSVIAKSLKCAMDVNKSPGDFSDDVSGKLKALDELRQGNVRDALDYMDIPYAGSSDEGEFKILPSVPENVDIDNYEFHPEGFKSDMKDLAKKLASVGL